MDTQRKISRLLMASGLLVGLTGLSGCGETYVQDPWVGSPEQYEQERARSEAQAKALRERLTQIQTDR